MGVTIYPSLKLIWYSNKRGIKLINEQYETPLFDDSLSSFGQNIWDAEWRKEQVDQRDQRGLWLDWGYVQYGAVIPRLIFPEIIRRETP